MATNQNNPSTLKPVSSSHKIAIPKENRVYINKIPAKHFNQKVDAKSNKKVYVINLHMIAPGETEPRWVYFRVFPNKKKIGHFWSKTQKGIDKDFVSIVLDKDAKFDFLRDANDKTEFHLTGKEIAESVARERTLFYQTHPKEKEVDIVDAQVTEQEIDKEIDSPDIAQAQPDQEPVQEASDNKPKAEINTPDVENAPEEAPAEEPIPGGM